MGSDILAMGVAGGAVYGAGECVTTFREFVGVSGKGMKIAHLCLSNFYIDDRAYQENELVAAHARAGHDVLVLASTQIHGDDGRRAFTRPGGYRTDDGARIIRLPYHSALPHFLAKSLRVHRGVYKLLAEFAPDTILFHGICGWELLTAARYRRDHPGVPLFVDTHADFLNSARGLVSKWGLHYLYYRPIVHRALPMVEKVLCISALTQDFARDFYGIPEDKLEFYPLGGRPLPDDELAERREATRAAHGIGDDEILFVQSGKQSARKYLVEALRAFAAVTDSRFRLLIAGMLMDDISEEAEGLIAADPRVRFIGWTRPDELEDLLCAADVYLQPGSQSSTMQTSLCCGCAVILEGLRSHEPYVSNNGWLLGEPTELAGVYREISEGSADLAAMGRNSLEFGRARLDYARLALRILPGYEAVAPAQQQLEKGPA